MEHQKCIIIGAGPAGYTAAIYAARANLKPVMLTGSQPGGQLMITNDVENFPGYPQGINGPQMMDEFKQQAVRFGTDIRFNQVMEVDFSQHPYILKLDNGTKISSDSIIIATGASAKWLRLESEQRLNGSGVSACAVCDGFFYRGKEVIIVGGGDSACEEALYLSNLCPTVHMLVRKDHLRASKIMQDRVLKKENIKVYWNTETVEVLGKQEVEGARVRNTETGESTEISAEGFFVAIGHRPNSSFLKPSIHTDEQGYIITKADSTETNIPGVFACGDVKDKKFRQAVTAAGSGCMAALEAEKYLMRIEDQITV
ncbi:thioredoxin-disulfide reductase [Limibacter armeniacum]|uniref:thioredoxin-disulfide reductase n=1 Tax=Limibacter armeniacum TaxID=466084 RepID=UPI002FE51672